MRLIPHPFFLYSISASYVLMGVGDLLYQTQRHEEALSTMRLAMFISGTIGTAYAHYLLGQIHRALGNEDKAANELGRALLLDEDGALFGNNNDDEDEVEEEDDEDRELLDLAIRGAKIIERQSFGLSSS